LAAKVAHMTKRTNDWLRLRGSSDLVCIDFFSTDGRSLSGQTTPS
jgi:hypothetical protein